MKNASMKDFHLYKKYVIIKKQKWKYIDFMCAINCTHKLTCACACMSLAHAIAWDVSGNCMYECALAFS